MNRGTIAEIDLEAIAHNFRTAKKITRNKTVIAVVKADAYGHGACEVAARILKERVLCFAVAYTSEAVALREAGIKTPIIVLFDKYNIGDYFKYNLIPVIHDIKTARKFSKEAAKRKKPISVHLKIDTGMGRIGFTVPDMLKDIFAISGMDYMVVRGLMSHFSEADLSDRSYALIQLRIFNNVRKLLLDRGIRPSICHIANSAAIMTLPESYLDAVRPGLMLYGCSPLQKSAISYQPSAKDSRLKTPDSKLFPAMTVKAKILSLRRLKKGTSVSYGRTFITVRDSIVAVLSVGYADGYSRAFSNNADVLIRGKRAPVAGRVCMDTTMVDVTEIEGVSEGDDAVILGRQKSEYITATELSERTGTISYEILTSLGGKAKRIYTTH
ncbi:MAG: alanine racemase [Nitrospirae bacterium]|nr:alanine racemase [Nitrospirota bacterium]